jgi:phosphoglucomutase
MIDEQGDYTSTPATSHAILQHNRGRTRGLADGIVITSSYNPPEEGEFKYNPPHGDPADTRVTDWIQTQANAILSHDLKGAKRLLFEEAQRASTTHRYNYMDVYIGDLVSVLDMEALRSANLNLGMVPLGGVGVQYWERIRDQYQLPLTVVNDAVDPTFRFMSLDWDGKIRMDCSSPYALQGLIALNDRFDVAWGCGTDHDCHGIVSRSRGLLNFNHFLAVAIWYLFSHRPQWPKAAGVGKTVVSGLIDRVAVLPGAVSAVEEGEPLAISHSFV